MLQNNGDIIDILSTINSVYGYFSVNGGFKIDKTWDSFSTTIRAKVGLIMVEVNRWSRN